MITWPRLPRRPRRPRSWQQGPVGQSFALDPCQPHRTTTTNNNDNDNDNSNTINNQDIMILIIIMHRRKGQVQHPEQAADEAGSEKGEVLLRGVGTLWYLLILRENSACQVPICVVAAWWFDNPHPKVVPRSRIPRSTSHFSYFGDHTDPPHPHPRHLLDMALNLIYAINTYLLNRGWWGWGGFVWSQYLLVPMI